MSPTAAETSLTVRRRRLLLGAGRAPAAPALLGQDGWPARPVKIIVAFPPGQTSDIYARVSAKRNETGGKDGEYEQA